MGAAETIAVIGGGAAGISAGSMAKRTNPDATVIVCTEFEDVAYSPCGIPYVLAGEIPEFQRLFLAGPENYAEAGIDLRLETRVTEIDGSAQTMVANGETVPWDKLIICTGWNYLLPDVPGNDLEGITFVKNIRRGIELNETLNDVKTAVVLEAGPLGVEMMAALAHRDIDTTLIDPNPWLLGQVADEDIAAPVQENLAQLGVTQRYSTELEGFTGTGGRLDAVATSDGEIPADICVIATHKEPDTELARAIGVATGSTGAIRVNERMETSVPNVYAAGDAVEVPQMMTGVAVQGLTGSHAMQQGRVAGANAGGDSSRTYSPVTIPWGMVGGQVQIGGASFGETLATSLGLPFVVGKAQGISRARYFPGVQQVHVKLLADPSSRALIGAQMVGGEGIKERADFLAFALKKEATLDDIAWMENVYSPPIGALYEPMSVAAQNAMAQL